jgi:hypothetical protein
MLIINFTISAQISGDSIMVEQKRINFISKFSSLDYYNKPSSLRAGDLIMAYYSNYEIGHGIVDGFEESGIRVIHYPYVDTRMITTVELSKIYVPNISKTGPLKRIVTERTEVLGSNYKENDSKFMMYNVSKELIDAGECYRTSEHLFMWGIASFVVGSLLSYNDIKNQTISFYGPMFYGTGLVLNISSYVYRYKGHNKIKRGGEYLKEYTKTIK